jgi:hypothetical protein
VSRVLNWGRMVFAPQGQQDSARRFNAGKIQSNGFALQGREIGGRYQGRILYDNSVFLAPLQGASP